MDINCVSGCAYQFDGKCTLMEVPRNPAETQASAQFPQHVGSVSLVPPAENSAAESYCPYFTEKIKR